MVTKHLKIRESNEGFTLLEVLVSTALTSIIMAMVVKALLTNHSIFSNDTLKTRLNGNLRISMDLLGVNIKQAGENLTTGFPAVLLEEGNDSSKTRLTLRRSKVPEVLTVCNEVRFGDSQIKVSDNLNLDPECEAVNVQPLFDLFASERTDKAKKLFIYDSVAKQGEFVDFNSSNSSGGIFTLITSSLSNDYPRLTSAVYMLEEMVFSLDTISNTLEMELDGEKDSPEAIAFDIKELNFKVVLRGDAEHDQMLVSSAHSWTDLKSINITLNAEEQIRDKTISGRLENKFFPRNVLSNY